MLPKRHPMKGGEGGGGGKATPFGWELKQVFASREEAERERREVAEEGGQTYEQEQKDGRTKDPLVRPSVRNQFPTAATDRVKAHLCSVPTSSCLFRSASGRKKIVISHFWNGVLKFRLSGPFLASAQRGNFCREAAKNSYPRWLLGWLPGFLPVLPNSLLSPFSL